MGGAFKLDMRHDRGAAAVQASTTVELFATILVRIKAFSPCGP